MTDRSRKIAALRALAASTTFPSERESALAKAAALEEIEGEADELGIDTILRFPTFEEAMAGNWRNLEMERDAIRRAAFHLSAIEWDDGLWVVPGHGPPLDKTGLIRLYALGA